jgi:hypothetical protein
MKKLLLSALFIAASFTSIAKVGIGTTNPHASAALEIESTTKGFLPPRMTTTERDAISSPGTGLMIYQTDGATGFYYYNGSSWTTYYSQGQEDALKASNPCDPPRVGDIYAGGVVFWVDPSDNRHGLVCAIRDQESAGIESYKGRYRRITGAMATAIGTGSANTTAIIARQGVVETLYAAGLARGYRGGGYTDWFLPSKDELNEIYKNKATIDSTAAAHNGSTLSSSHFYWSSTESDKYNAWFQYFHNGAQYEDNKNHSMLVRAVRTYYSS